MSEAGARRYLLDGLGLGLRSRRAAAWLGRSPVGWPAFEGGMGLIEVGATVILACAAVLTAAAPAPPP